MLEFDVLRERRQRIIAGCELYTHEVEVVLRPNEDEMRGNGSWKWCGILQLPECIVVEGKSCQYMCVVWLNEVFQMDLKKVKPMSGS